MNTIVVIGFLSGRICYVNRPQKECYIEYLMTEYPTYGKGLKAEELELLSEAELVALIIKADLEISIYSFAGKFGAYDIDSIEGMETLEHHEKERPKRRR